MAHPHFALKTEQAAALPADPIFAAISRYRRACTALEATRFAAAAEDELSASGEALFATKPTTLAGCRALVNFIIDDAGEEDLEGSWYLDGLNLVSEALANLAGQTPKG